MPIAATKDHPRRADYEYERAGTASIFMFCEPLSCWRQVTVRERRTKIDWGIEVAELLRTRYATAGKVILICDNLNTHTKGAFYEPFDPETARAILRRLEFRHTPKHGSWLNVAENELSSMTRQCVTGQRFATIDALRSETAVWQEPNAKRIAKRLLKHQGELTAFLHDKDLDATNNAAERALRPAVVMRKITGGSRSQNGAQAWATLASLMKTATQQNHNLLDTIRSMLIAAWSSERPPAMPTGP